MSTCGTCGWCRKGVCRNPQSVREDTPVNKITEACSKHQEQRK